MKDTPIQWCDSAVNLMMGCDGCELWGPARGVRHCYAGALHRRFAGRSKGWPESFDRPALFTGKLGEALRWRDLRGRGPAMIGLRPQCGLEIDARPGGLPLVSDRKALPTTTAGRPLGRRI
jgi:hypothetical protein